MRLHFRPFDADNRYHELESRASSVVGPEPMRVRFSPGETGAR